MNEIQKQILLQLNAIEAELHIKIPLAIESGSRAWGFASPDSDYDCRFVYVRPREWYLSVIDRKDTIDYKPDAVFDVNGWDVKKVIQHLVKSNAVMLEWLSSGVIYRKDNQVWQELWRLGEAFFNPVAMSWHYLSMARNKLGEILESDTAKIKRYVYALRPLSCIRFIETHGKIPHMEYRRNLAEIEVAPAVLEQIELLLKAKETAKEGDWLPRNQILIRYIQSECAWAEQWLATLHPVKNRDYEQADEAFRRIIEMVWSND